ncbi:MAG: insulinase family protein, partial [Chloroflexi bacterium]|nr:insulinase family protein [Chloroflexota bacterium]
MTAGAGRLQRPPEEPGVSFRDLSNGMLAVVKRRVASEVAAVSVGVRGGSRDEEERTVGAAHFMEHMYFQGTPTRSGWAEIDGPISARGGWLNAWTGWESINFQV